MVTLTTSEIMDVFDVGSSGTLSKWKELGAKEACISRNKWDLKEFFNWFLENIYTGLDPEMFKEDRLRYEKARADKMELEVAKLKGDVMPKAEIEKAWAARMAIIVNGLTIYQDRLPPLLEGKTKGEMRDIIKKENNRLRDWYCKQGEYTPKG
ncbi:MAG: hypothetical protein H8D67_18835 [Deltaproteobacteria bacterium]|nr:hypothetical protein [Deltaproteobacteria bacterium]